MKLITKTNFNVKKCEHGRYYLSTNEDMIKQTYIQSEEERKMLKENLKVDIIDLLYDYDIVNEGINRDIKEIIDNW